MAKGFHDAYVAANQERIPSNMRRWEELETTYVRANLEQARYAVNILRKNGFDIVPDSAPGLALNVDDLSSSLEAMSELEHGRWNVERLTDGWRFGERDNVRKTHNCLIPWKDLLQETRDWDRKAIRNYPDILAKVGMKIIRQVDK